DERIALQSFRRERALHRGSRGLGVATVFVPAEHAWAATRNAGAERAVVERGLFDAREARYQGCAARFHQHVAQPFAHQRGVAPKTAGQHQGEIGALRHELAQRVVARKRSARPAGFQYIVRMHQRAMPCTRHRDAQQVIVRSEHHPTEQHRTQVVAVAAASGSRHGDNIEPRLSPWRLPLATASPSSAKRYSASRGSGCSSKALAATNAATHDAAEPPIPEPSGMPLCRINSKPCGKPSASRNFSSAMPAVLRSGSTGRFVATPSIAAMRTTGSSITRTSARSPAPAMPWPRMSKPTPILPTLAGANACATRIRGAVEFDSVFSIMSAPMMAPPACRRSVAYRRIRPRRSPRVTCRSLAPTAGVTVVACGTAPCCRSSACARMRGWTAGQPTTRVRPWLTGLRRSAPHRWRFVRGCDTRYLFIR